MDDIKPLFEKHGQIARFIMPAHCITVLVDFVEPFEAKKAFTKLAYSQFKSTPLYLEWAPEDVFVTSRDKTEETVKETNEKKDITTENKNVEAEEKAEIKNVESEKSETEDIEEPERDTTLFVKNLNFKTTEDLLKQVCGIIH